MNQKEDIIQSIISELRKKSDDLEGVYLFGSRSTGEFTIDSDWDFAYLCRKGLDDEINWELKVLIESNFDTKIDLVDLYKATTILQITCLKQVS